MAPPARDPLLPVEVRTRAFEVQGAAWIAHEAGRASAGVGHDPGAPLVHLVFHSAVDADRPLSEVLVSGQSLEEMAESDLEAAFSRARPLRERQERREVFSDTRRKGDKGM